MGYHSPENVGLSWESVSELELMIRVAKIATETVSKFAIHICSAIVGVRTLLRTKFRKWKAYRPLSGAADSH